MLRADERISLLKDVCADRTLMNDYVQGRNMLGMLALEIPDSESPDVTAMYDDIRHTLHKRRRHLLLLKVTRYAAAVLLLATGIWLGATIHHDEEPPTAYCTVTVPAGQRSQVKLSDGTEVWLNSGATLIYPGTFGRESRQVKLNGEGYFQVTHNESHPFMVNTGNARVTVYGTTFNVNATTRHTQVSLIEGSVMVSDTHGGNVMLKPMEKVIASTEGMELSQINDESPFLWRKGLISFENMTFADICSRLEQYYNIEIEILNTPLSGRTFSGTFRLSDGASEILRILSKIHSFKIEYTDSSNIIIIR